MDYTLIQVYSNMNNKTLDDIILNINHLGQLTTMELEKYLVSNLIDLE